MSTTLVDVRTDTTGARSDRRPRGRWSYPAGPGRDRRLDLLRGYALAAMSINHFGLSNSYLHEFSGRSQFLLSAAEAFLFISGFTLGFITIGRTPEEATVRLGRRTWTVYLATVGISLGLGVVAMTTDLSLWGELPIEESDGVWPWIGRVAVLGTAFNGGDILIAYVLYLTAAIGALRLMTAGRSRVVVAATAGAYLLSQLAGPDNVSLGFASFRVLLPNAPLFFGGLLIGYHRERIATVWRSVPFRPALDAAVLALAVGLAWLHQGGWQSFRWLGELVAGPDLGEPLWLRESEMPPIPLLVVLLYLRVAWIVVDALWVPLRTALGWLLLPLGEASLFTFGMHLVAIPIVFNLAWFPDDDLGRAGATFWTVVFLGIIYGAVLIRRRALAWVRVDRSPRPLIRRHGPVVAVGLLVVATVVAGAS
ncbi:MAG: OpgC domain-containing protein [Actinomycetota bacterium]